MINIFYEDIDELALDFDFLESWLANVCLSEQKSLAEVNLIFCSDEYLLEMNNQYLQHDYYTDIITFDYCEGDLIIGDLFISVDRVKENAVLNKVELSNELNRVVVHGVLHLCGFKDKSDDEEKLMRSKEDFYLDKIVPRGT